jgi:hypothetical protein
MGNILLRALVASCALMVLLGCGNSTSLQPVVPTGNETIYPPVLATRAQQQTREPKAITLPTPTTQVAPKGYYQDDNGLRLAIAKVEGQTIPKEVEDNAGLQYVVLTLTLMNFADAPKDVTGFPFTVWLTDAVTSEDYAPEVYAPYTNGLWDAIEKLNKGTDKKLNKNQTIRGELFFKTPLGAQNFSIVWQPDVRRQWVLRVPTVR